MIKILKKILITNASLLILTGIGMSTSNIHARRHHVRTFKVYEHHVKHSSWHRGIPKVLHKRSYWVSDFLTDKYPGYSRLVFPMNSKKGIDLYSLSYKTKHSKAFPGTNVSGAFAEVYPYYKSLGHGKYLMTSGDSLASRKHSHLYYDLESNVYLVKMHGNNHLSLWTYITRNRKSYYGCYTRYPYNRRLLDKIVNSPGDFNIN